MLHSNSDVVPVIIALGDFASGVVSWAFRLRDAMAEHPRYRPVLVNCYKTGNKIGRFDEEATSVSAFAALLERYERGIVVPNFVWDAFPVCASLMAQGRNFRLIGFCRADNASEYYDPLRWYAPVVARFAAVSPVCAANLAGCLPERAAHIVEMPTGVTVPGTLARTWQRSPLRLAYGGRIVQEQKRVMDLVPLLARLRGSGTSFTLDIAGVGRQLEELKAAFDAEGLTSCVHFTGRIAPERMPRFWADHDVFLQTSAYEGTSNSMLEAMAQGAIPVVTRTESGVAGIIREGVNGFLIEIGDMAAMADVVSGLSARNDLDALGAAAHGAAKPYAIERYVDRFTAMLDDAWATPAPEIPSALAQFPQPSFEGVKLHRDVPDAVAAETGDTLAPGPCNLLISFPSHLRGGAEDYTLAIAKGALQRRWQVLTGFTQRKETASLRKDFASLGAVCHTLEICELGDVKKRAIFRKRVTRMARFLFRHRPDALLLELPGIQYGLGVMLGAALTGTPVVSVFQLVRDDMTVPFYHRLALKVLSRFRQRYVAVSNYSRDVLALKTGLPPGRIHVIPNGADIDRFSISCDERNKLREETRHQLGFDDDTIALVTVGRLAPQKGHDLLAPAIPHILERYPTARFLWVGDGPLEGKLRSSLRQYGVEEYVQFLGRRDDVPALLAAADLFVHPTRFEGLPFSVVEAMAAGVPVVSTRASSIPEIITHGESGLLCEVEDIRELREAILYALDHPDQMSGMAHTARARVNEFSEANMVAKTLGLIEDMIGNKS